MTDALKCESPVGLLIKLLPPFLSCKWSRQNTRVKEAPCSVLGFFLVTVPTSRRSLCSQEEHFY